MKARAITAARAGGVGGLFVLESEQKHYFARLQFYSYDCTFLKYFVFRVPLGAQTVKQTWNGNFSKSATLRESETYYRRIMNEN